MKIHQFVGTDSREVMQQIKSVLGGDAVILSNRQIDGGIEMVATLDYQSPEAVTMVREQHGLDSVREDLQSLLDILDEPMAVKEG